MDWRTRYRDKLITAEQAAALVKSGERLGLPMWDPPRDICLALARRRQELRGVVIQGLHSERFPWLEPGWEDSFEVQDFFVLRDLSRKAVWERRIDWMPWIAGLSCDASRSQAEPDRSAICINADVYMCRLTPPDEEGYCSFGRSVWYSPAAIRTAKAAIAEIDPAQIWTFGERVHISEVDYLVARAENDYEVPHTITPVPPPDEVEKAAVIGALTSELVRDGDTIQVGTGAASEAVQEFLGAKNDLGLDTEIIFPLEIELVRSGVITGKHKNLDPGKHTGSAIFLYGGDQRNAAALAFVNGNPAFEVRDGGWQLNIGRIASIRNLVAINTAVTIDLTGQIAIDHLGPLPISGAGGQVEFNIGSHYAPGGRSITALMSTAQGGALSRIVPQLEPGTMVHVSCGYIDYLVTEHGVVNLECKTRRQRAEAIISVAHPDFQPELRKAARRLFYP